MLPDVKPAASDRPLAPPPAPGPMGTIESTDTHLLDRLAVLYRYRAVAASVFVLSALAVVLQGYTAVAMYRAQARVLIEDERSTAIPGLTSPETTFYEDPEPYYQTQYKILKGRDLVRRVVQRLHLENNPEFNGRAPVSRTPISFFDDLKARVRSLLFTAPPPSAPEPDETPDESALVDAFIGRLSVQPVPGSRLVDVTFESEHPEFAAQAVNALVDEYVAQNLEVKLQSTQNMIEWLDKELGNQQKKVEESERALAEYRDKENALSLDDKQNIIGARLNQLNDAVIRAKTARVQKEALYNQVRSLEPGAAGDTLPAIAQNAQLIAIRSHLTDLQRDRVKLSERYGDKHPEILKVNAAIQDTQRQLQMETAKVLQTIKNDYETAVLEEQTLSRNLDAAKADASDLSRKGINYGMMEREAKSNRQVYEALLQRENELRVSSNSRANNVRVVDHAEVPKAPANTSGRRSWLMAIGLGLGLAVAVAFALDYMNDTVKTPEDVARHLKLPFLGLVPSVRGDKHPVLASSHVPHDFGEAFRALRTSIVAAFPADGAKVLLVTSAQPLEGKTTTACNIAMALAYGGSRVLLIDADMRRPGMHRPLRLTNERGLSQVLIGQARVRDVIQRTVDPNLLAITAGRTPPNPSELLSSERMKTLLANLQHGPFDWIVIDTPPVLAVTDAVVLAPAVSGVAFVVGAEMTRRRLAERAVQTMLSNRPQRMAVILNRVDFSRNKYYYSRYYGHQYRNYYAESAV
jgi:capsular exopolysaccharide synthesis family protein